MQSPRRVPAPDVAKRKKFQGQSTEKKVRQGRIEKVGCRDPSRMEATERGLRGRRLLERARTRPDIWIGVMPRASRDAVRIGVAGAGLPVDGGPLKWLVISSSGSRPACSGPH